MVGIPGVGKTTLLTKIKEMLANSNKHTSFVSFGTLMFDVVRENGISDRDELRRLPLPKQHELQMIAAQKIAAQKDTVIVDTHAFINSPEGYYPGLPKHVLDIISPSNFISISAKPEEIFSRRLHDTTRDRDQVTIDNIKKELDVQSGMISTCVILTGSPVKHILNSEGAIDQTAAEIIESIGL